MPPAATLARLRRSRSGTAATEFCLVAPVLLLMAGGVVEFGRAFQTDNEANRLATQYAIAFADCSDVPAGACRTELASYVAPASVANVSPQLNPDRYTLTMFQVRMAGANPAVVYSEPSGAALTAGQIAAARTAIADGQSGVVVTVTYEHRIELFAALMSRMLGPSIQIPYTVAQLKS